MSAKWEGELAYFEGAAKWWAHELTEMGRETLCSKAKSIDGDGRARVERGLADLVSAMGILPEILASMGDDDQRAKVHALVYYLLQGSAQIAQVGTVGIAEPHFAKGQTELARDARWPRAWWAAFDAAIAEVSGATPIPRADKKSLKEVNRVLALGGFPAADAQQLRRRLKNARKYSSAL